ncbi:MAG TPA: hypothetical protein VIF32_08440 [Gemmatimonadaceae bacterium]
MRTSNAAVAALVVLGALVACSKNEKTTADTTTVPGVDTTKGMAMPTTDTVVKTTTTKTDTIQGQVPRDSVKASTKSKTKTGTKAKTKTKGY